MYFRVVNKFMSRGSRSQVLVRRSYWGLSVLKMEIQNIYNKNYFGLVDVDVDMSFVNFHWRFKAECRGSSAKA